MNVSVWDTYVKRDDGRLMHFDIIVPESLTDKQKILSYGRDYLKNKSINSKELTSEECRFCHIEVAPDIISEKINYQGYFIVEMENCN